MKKPTLLKTAFLSTALVTISVVTTPLCAAERVIQDYTLRNSKDIEDIQAKVKAMDVGDPYGSTVQQAIDLAQNETEYKVAQAKLATNLTQNTEIAKALRAQQAKGVARSDSIRHYDADFSLFIQSLLDYRNRLTVCPHMNNPKVLPYAFTTGGKFYYTAEMGACGLQSEAFALTALLSQLKAELDAPVPSAKKITKCFNAMLQQAKSTARLIRFTEEKSYISIYKQVIEGMDDKLNTVKAAINDARKIEDENAKDKALADLFDKFLGSAAAIGVQAAGTVAGDPMIGMTVGSSASEFGSSVANLITGPILKNSEIQRQRQQIANYGSLGAFNSASLDLLANSLQLGKDLFIEQWITQWENTADNLISTCTSYFNALRDEIALQLQNLVVVAPRVDGSNRSTAINNVLLDILSRVQNLEDDINTVSDIADDESLENPLSDFNKYFSADSETTAHLQTAVTNLRATLTGRTSLSTLLNGLFKNWQDFQTISGDIESIKSSYILGQPNTDEDEKKLGSAITSIATIKSSISSLSSSLISTLYPNALTPLITPGIREMASYEISSANSALVKAAPLIVGDMVANEQNLLMVLSTNTLSITLANEWAIAMRNAHAQYSKNLSKESLSLVIQYAFSIDEKGRKEAFNSMGPRFAHLGDYTIIAPLLSMRISNAHSLLQRLPLSSVGISDTIAQMQADLDNLNKWIDDYITDANDYLNT